MTHEAGKGSRPRPFSIAQDEYEKRWDAIFGRDLKEDNKENQEIDDRITRNNSETQFVKENKF